MKSFQLNGYSLSFSKVYKEMMQSLILLQLSISSINQIVTVLCDYVLVCCCSGHSGSPYQLLFSTTFCLDIIDST